MKLTNKKLKQSQVKQWIDHALKSNRGQAEHVINSALNQGIDIEREIESMTTKQAQTMLKLMSLMYGTGCATTREFFKSTRERDEVQS